MSSGTIFWKNYPSGKILETDVVIAKNYLSKEELESLELIVSAFLDLAVNRAVEYYRNKGYTDDWIKARLTGIVDRFKLTDVWKEGGINKPIEYALLTNEIYKGWSGMKASEYKKYKGIRKESLRDNMTDIEVALTNIGKIAARDIAITEKTQGLEENLKVAKGARDLYEKETKKSAISNKNSLNYKYVDEVKVIESKGNDSNE